MKMNLLSPSLSSLFGEEREKKSLGWCTAPGFIALFLDFAAFEEEDENEDELSWQTLF